MDSLINNTHQALVLEPSHPRFSTLCCPTVPYQTRESRHTSEELGRKKRLKRQRGCRCCVECGFWKYRDGFVRSLAKLGSPRFKFQVFRSCNQCSRRRKGLDEDEHFEQYGAVDYNP